MLPLLHYLRRMGRCPITHASIFFQTMLRKTALWTSCGVWRPAILVSKWWSMRAISGLSGQISMRCAVRHWENGIEVVAGARANREETWALRTCRRIFYRIVSLISEFDIPENVGEFQLIDRKVWQVVVSHNDQYPYLRGIIASVGFRRLILPYTWRSRKRGISKNNVLRLIDQGMNGIFSFTSAPMRFSSFLGFAIASLALFYALIAVGVGIFIPGVAPRGTHTIIAALFFFSGVQLMFIGILGEYITAIHAQVRRGPMVVERELINIKTKPEPAVLSATGAPTDD